MKLNEIITLAISSLALIMSVLTYLWSLRLSSHSAKIDLEQKRQKTLLLITRIQEIDFNIARKLSTYATLAKGTAVEQVALEHKENHESILKDAEILKRNFSSSSDKPSTELMTMFEQTLGGLEQLEFKASKEEEKIDGLILTVKGLHSR